MPRLSLLRPLMMGGRHYPAGAVIEVDAKTAAFLKDKKRTGGPIAVGVRGGDMKARKRPSAAGSRPQDGPQVNTPAETEDAASSGTGPTSGTDQADPELGD